jgi:hypothetical protein
MVSACTPIGERPQMQPGIANDRRCHTSSVATLLPEKYQSGLPSLSRWTETSSGCCSTSWFGRKLLSRDAIRAATFPRIASE